MTKQVSHRLEGLSGCEEASRECVPQGMRTSRARVYAGLRKERADHLRHGIRAYSPVGPPGTQEDVILSDTRPLLTNIAGDCLGNAWGQGMTDHLASLVGAECDSLLAPVNVREAKCRDLSSSNAVGREHEDDRPVAKRRRALGSNSRQ
jgi:hypothetical protein